MKRLNLRLDGKLLEMWTSDATKNKRGPQAEFEFLIERALCELERVPTQAPRPAAASKAPPARGRRPKVSSEGGAS